MGTIWNHFLSSGCVDFPDQLLHYGLNEELLKRAFSQSIRDQELCWSLKETPTVGFYRELHNFLKKWPLSRSVTKTAIGKFYARIDPELHTKSTTSGRLDNLFQFIEKVVISSKPHSTPMQYGLHATIQHLRSEVSECSAEIQELSAKVVEQEQELSAMKRKVEKAREELSDTRHALKDTITKLQLAQKQRDCARNQTLKSHEKLETTITDSVHFEEELLAKNHELSELVATLWEEIAMLSTTSAVSLLGSVDESNDSFTFCFQTKEGGKIYTPAIRELYYSLLADQMPPAKIANTIKTILKCFLPSFDLNHLQLPSESCASYMRRHELTTVSLVHKATSVLEQANSESLHLNTDGTTKFQKKLEGAAINGMVLSVNEVPDGSADSIINDVSAELQKLREVAHALRMPNADKINWTLIVSSSSDSASTQKRFNKLLEEQRRKDEEKFGAMCPDAIELVENFCCMHLGVNLRKAFLDGIRSLTSPDSTSSPQQHERHPTDTLVHEFCKLLGKHGVPEYGLGVLAFPDFLKERCSSDCERASYYQLCTKVRLDRQVGSRYFVTASNARKILFLREAAIDFLQYAGKSVGNKLEQDVFRKLQDSDELSQLKADALMFHHVYSNLVMLAKSNELNKSAFDMNQHYLELRLFLEEVELNPQIAMDKEFKVFASEERLYGVEKKINHRLHSMSKPIEDQLFKEDEWDSSLLYPLLTVGALAMKEKLCVYAQNQLPGGKYWEPEPAIKATLQKLKPNNDLCESILGLNDYLTTAIPNLHQMTRSNLIQVKKNKTMQWLNQLPNDQQRTIVKLAIQRRGEVAKHFKKEALRSRQRREKMDREKCRRDALNQRAIREREKLSMLHLIASPEELSVALSEIDDETISAKKKREKKLVLLREQINIRKKVLKQKVKIPFTHNRRQRQLTDIIRELSDFIAMNSGDSYPDSEIHAPESLVGKKVLHKFEVEGEEKWYTGYVVSYNAVTHLHEVAYEEEEENFHFNLLGDISQGDLIIND